MDWIHCHDVHVWLRVGMRQLSRFLGLFLLGFCIRFQSKRHILIVRRGTHCCHSHFGAILFSLDRSSIGAGGKGSSVVDDIYMTQDHT